MTHSSEPQSSHETVRPDLDPTIRIPIDGLQLDALLAIPSGATGLVLFAHGSGSGRMSPRNRFVAEQLQRAGLATLLLDLLTGHEEHVDRSTGALRFDIPFLATRLGAVTDVMAHRPEVRHLRFGYFGASTGAAAALVAAAERPQRIAAIVSRGGRPDLAGASLARVTAPTLLIVGGADADVLRLNRAALRSLAGPRRLAVVPGATHLFEEAGALETVARLAARWFEEHLVTAGTHPAPVAEAW